MSQSLQIDTDEILRGIAFVAAINRDPSTWQPAQKEDARAVIRAGLRKFFHPTLDGRVYQWKFLERHFTFSGQASQSSSTVTVVGGVVTIAAGTWPSWADDGILRLGGRTYYVESRDSDTQLTINDLGADYAAGTTYEIHRWRYPMPSDYGDLIDGVLYQDGASNVRQLRGAVEQEIRLRHEVQFEEGRTSQYAIFAGNDSDASTWYLTTWPIVDPDAYIMGTYRQVPLDKLDNTDVTTNSTVQINPVHAETLMAAILSEAESYYNDEIGGTHAQRYDRLLAASMAHDRHSQGPVDIDMHPKADPTAVSLLTHNPTYGDLLP